MDETNAIELARKFLSENNELEIHSEITPQTNFYEYNPENEILISFSLFETPKLGPSKYITISKSDGTIKYIGEHGE